MSIINSSYFVGENNIPNTNYPEVGSLVTLLIDTHEKDYLQCMLGYELFKLFNAGIAEVTPDAKWISLRDGEEFTGTDGRLKKWEGFKNLTTFESPIADYIFYQYLKHNASQQAAMGEVRSDTANATPVTAAHRMARVWNRMVDSNRILYDFFQAKQTIYPEFFTNTGTRALRNLLTRINAYNI